MVGDMLGEDDEPDGDEQQGEAGDGRHTVEHGAALLQGLDEGELRHAEDIAEVQGREGGIVDDLEVRDIRGLSDQGEDGGEGITGEDADDERDHFDLLAALDRGKDGDEEGHDAAEDGDEVILAVGGRDVGDGGGGEGKSDEGDGRSDDDGRHQLADPLGTDEVDDDGDDDVDQTGKQGTDDDAEEAKRGRADEGGNEREGGAEEDGASALGAEDIHEGADARAEQGGGLVHHEGILRAVDNGGDEKGRRDDRQKLLEREDEVCAEFRFLLYAVGQLHTEVLLKRLNLWKRYYAHI